MRLPKIDRELLGYAGVAALALGLRLAELDDRPFQYDEGQVAYFSWLFSTTGEYEYQPVLHGPLLYYLNSLAFVLGGASDLTARLGPALAGTALVLLPAAIRRQIGAASALIAALLLAVSPSFLYYSRFAREDIVVTALTLALLVVGIRMFDRPRRWHPAAIGALLAACFATKETTFISVAVAGAGLCGAAVAGWPVVARVRSIGLVPWLVGLASFALVFTMLFSTFYTNLDGVPSGIFDGPRYWAEQHEVNRGGEDWPLYLAIFVSHEWLVLGLGLLGIAAALRDRLPTQLFLVWLVVAATAVYSYAGERFAWLALQPLVPLTLLAGVGFGAVWTGAPRARPVLAPLVAAALAAFTWSAVGTSFERGADPRELLVVVHSSPELDRARERVLRLARRYPGLTIEVDASEFSTYPWAWHFRALRAEYLDMQQETYRPSGDVLVMTDPARELDPDRLSGYRGRPFVQRRWWVRDYSRLTPASLVRWFSRRAVWGERGSLGSWLYLRRGALNDGRGR